MRPTPWLRLACLTAVVTIALLAFSASPASASRVKDDRATGLITTSGPTGCLLTDSVSWDRLPPIYQIDTELNQNGAPFTGGASIISYPQLDEPALTSPQVIETFFFDPDVFTFNYTVTFVLKDRHRRVVATTTSPDLFLSCFP